MVAPEPDLLQHPDLGMETSGLTNLQVKQTFTLHFTQGLYQRVRPGQSPVRNHSSVRRARQHKRSRGAAVMPRAPGAAANMGFNSAAF